MKISKGMIKSGKRFSGFISFFGGKSSGGGSFEKSKLLIALFEGAVYAGILFMVSLKWPAFWEAWNSPLSFFWITNALLLASIIGATLYRPWVWAVVLIVVIFIWQNYKKSLESPYDYSKYSYGRDQQKGSTGGQQDGGSTLANGGSAEYPTEGTGIATASSPIRARLYPGRSYLYPSVDAKYVSVNNPAIYFADTAIGKYNTNSDLWGRINEIDFDVYPWNKGDTLRFSWSLKKL